MQMIVHCRWLFKKSVSFWESHFIWNSPFFAACTAHLSRFMSNSNNEMKMKIKTQQQQQQKTKETITQRYNWKWNDIMYLWGISNYINSGALYARKLPMGCIQTSIQLCNVMLNALFTALQQIRKNLALFGMTSLFIRSLKIQFTN